MSWRACRTCLHHAWCSSESLAPSVRQLKCVDQDLRGSLTCPPHGGAVMALRGARGRAGEGVCVQASTLGSLEALLEFLRSPAVKIPVSGINIGPVHRRDVMRASVMLEKGRKKVRTHRACSHVVIRFLLWTC